MNKGDLTRQRIIAQAAPVFNQRGFTGSSMQDIMEATGLEKGGLYRHFPSKEDLAVEAFKYSLGQVEAARASQLGNDGTAIEQLLRAIDRFIETPSPVPGGCPIMNTAVDADDGNPTLLHLARTGLSSWKRRLAAVVQQGIQDGEIRPTVDPHRIANIVIATLEGALLITRLEGTRTALLDVRITLRQMIDALKIREAL